jgi:hypothetical protein
MTGKDRPAPLANARNRANSNQSAASHAIKTSVSKPDFAAQ